MMSGVVEPRIGFRARARKQFTNFIHSKSPKQELGQTKSSDSSGNVLNGGSFSYAGEEKELSAESFDRGSRASVEFDPLKRWDSVDCSLRTCPSDAVSSPWPEEFMCPLSKALMADPVIVDSGATYERRNVQAYLELGHRECFKTGETLEHLTLTKNSALKKAIDNWCDAHQVAKPVAPDAEAARLAVERVCEGLSTPKTTTTTTSPISERHVPSDTASSSDSSGGGSRSPGAAPSIPSSAAAPEMVRASSGDKILRPEQIPEASPVNASTNLLSHSHSSEWHPPRERVLEARQHHTWSGDKARKFTSPDRSTAEGAAACSERSSSTSANYMHSASVPNNGTASIDAHEGRGGGVPLPLTTTPSAFNGGSGVLPIHLGDLDEAAVSDLIQKLQHKHPLEQEQAVVEIRRLTRVSAQNRVALCQPAVFDVLLPLLQSRYSNVQINAVAAVMNLSIEKENKLKVARAGGIPFLVDVLKSGHFEAQEHAAGAIFSLALNDDNKMAIGVLGAIPPLIHVLRTGKHGARRDAAMALYHLSLPQMNRTKLIKAGGVGIFLGIARDERSDVVSRTLLILGNVAAMQDGRVALSELSAVQVMVGLLTKGDEKGSALDKEREEGSKVNWAEVREHAAATLLQLSHHNFRFKSQAVQAGALDALQRLQKEGTPRAREKATALLTILRDAPGADSPSEDNGSLYRRSYVRTNKAGLADARPDSAQF